MDEEDKIYISQNHTFFIGINHVRKEKILEWRNESDIDWPPFLWHVSSYMHVIDFGEDWVDIHLHTKKQLTKFYRNSIAYDPACCINEYETDKTSDLWKAQNSEHTDSALREKIFY